jgi:cytochrome c oxidase cbb3-type subunit I
VTPALAQPLPEGLPATASAASRSTAPAARRSSGTSSAPSSGSSPAAARPARLHQDARPGFLADADWLTFGRVRPAHLSTVIYGWGSMAGVGVLLWLQARLSRARLPLPVLLPVTVVVWNLAVLYGTVRILQGASTGIEWLEFPVEVLGFIGFCMAVIIVGFGADVRPPPGEAYLRVAVVPVRRRPLVSLPLHPRRRAQRGGRRRGVAKAAANWWFAHNVLGLWFTPIGLATAYYMIPKVIGRPVHSYHLSLLGFWTLAIFYNWAGTHHLIGGPLPAWLVTVGIVGSMMMFIPVITVAVNHHLTMVGHFHHLKTSPTLRFVVVAAMSYTVVSIQGSLTSLRAVNEVGHFTHYTVAHAHLGVYAFFTMMMFGAAYYILPRLMNAEWHSARWIRVHFWTTSLGMALYWAASPGPGWRQGQMMNDPTFPSSP